MVAVWIPGLFGAVRVRWGGPESSANPELMEAVGEGGGSGVSVTMASWGTDMSVFMVVARYEDHATTSPEPSGVL